MHIFCLLTDIYVEFFKETSIINLDVISLTWIKSVLYTSPFPIASFYLYTDKTFLTNSISKWTVMKKKPIKINIELQGYICSKKSFLREATIKIIIVFKWIFKYISKLILWNNYPVKSSIIECPINLVHHFLCLLAI